MEGTVRYVIVKLDSSFGLRTIAVVPCLMLIMNQFAQFSCIILHPKLLASIKRSWIAN